MLSVVSIATTIGLSLRTRGGERSARDHRMSERLESARPDETPAIVWLGFMAMCVGMFMAILDVRW